MFLPIISISLYLLLCSSIPEVSTICDETEFNCFIGAHTTCPVFAANVTRVNYLINKCTTEVAQSGIVSIAFSVYLDEPGGVITIDFVAGICRFSIYCHTMTSIEFISFQPQIEELTISRNVEGIINCHYDFLNYFPILTYLAVARITFDRFPYFNHTSLNTVYITLTKSNLTTIQPSMLILPNVNQIQFQQTEADQWYNITTNTFDNAPANSINLILLHCGCEVAWIPYVTTTLGWPITGTCGTPVSYNGNSIDDSSNYINCTVQSYHCLNDTFVCPPGSICVNTADSAYCDCGVGYTFNQTSNLCEDINECSGSHSCEQICTNSVGSYTCSCMPGFTLQSDNLSCVSGVSQLTAQVLIALISLLLQLSLL